MGLNRLSSKISLFLFLVSAIVAANGCSNSGGGKNSVLPSAQMARNHGQTRFKQTSLISTWQDVCTYEDSEYYCNASPGMTLVLPVTFSLVGGDESNCYVVADVLSFPTGDTGVSATLNLPYPQCFETSYGTIAFTVASNVQGAGATIEPDATMILCYPLDTGEGSLCEMPGSGFYGGTEVNVDVAASPSPTPSPTLQIYAGSTDVTGTAFTRVIGTQVTLTAKSSDGSAVSNCIWSIPGQPISNYTQVQQSAQITYLTAAMLQDKSVKFYSTAPVTSGQLFLQCTVASSGQMETASSTFSVKTPIPTVTTQTTAAPAVDQNYYTYQSSGYAIHFGQQTSATNAIGTGFVSTYSASGPAGSIKVLQLVADTSYNSTATGTVTNLGSNTGGASWPDKGCLIFDGMSSTVGASSAVTGTDAPVTFLSSGGGITKYVEADTYQDYFMFQSSQNNSIWVTLSTFQWGFSETATLSGATWLGSAGPGQPGDAVEPNELPTWTFPTPIPSFYANCPG